MNTESRELFQENEVLESVDIISEKRIEELKLDLSYRIGFDLTELPIKSVKAGDPIYDCLALQTKLQQVMPWSLIEPKLLHAGFDFNNLDRKSAEIITGIAQESGIKIDGSLPGFVYNLGGRQIIYLNPPKIAIADLARRYALKEGIDPAEVQDDPTEFISNLAEHYLPHEVGHSIELCLLTARARNYWANIVMDNEELVNKVIEVQKDKASDFSMIRVPEEAFADLFAAEYVYGCGNSRIGSFPHEESVLRKILKYIGLKINESSPIDT